MAWNHRARSGLALLVAVAVVGCAETGTRPAPAASAPPAAAPPAAPVPAAAAAEQPPPGQALVSFMRPSMFGFAISSSVFEVVDDHAVLVGIVQSKKRITAVVQPGEHLFMVIGESADFMTADVSADKSYYALVTPRVGAWKARFSLRPVHQAELGSPQFDGWLADSTPTIKLPKDDSWAAANLASVESKRAKYYPEWLRKAPGDRPALVPADGR
jgi:hypothetical protein